MKFAIKFFILAPIVYGYGHAHAITLKQTYLDGKQNVHVVRSDGKDIQVTQKGHKANVKLSSDGNTVAWLVSHTWKVEGQTETGSSELVVYRNGKARTIKCEPYIRDYWFWKKGSRVAIDCGGAHFAGREILYDTNTLKELETVDQSVVPTKDRPIWSASSDKYEPD